MLETKIDEWYGSAIRLYQLLLNDQAGTAKIIGGLFKSSISFGMALSELVYRYPERVFRNEIDHRGFYRILSPAKAKAVQEATAAVTITSPTVNVVKAKFEGTGTREP
jgi:hypothetical protein